MRAAFQVVGATLLVSTLSLASASDQPSSNPIPPAGETIEKIATSVSSDQQYSLYLPSAYSEAKKWPLLVIMDPRGRAPMALELFRASAERRGYILMSSYQTRSDTEWSVTTEALKAMLQEAETRYSIDESRVYLAGLSGTSRAAWAYAHALKGMVAGVVGVAGGRPATLEADDETVDFVHFGVTGTTDFNCREMVELATYLDGIGAQYRLEIVEGGHAWPPAEITNRAIDWFELQAMRAKQVPRSITFVDDEFELAVERLKTVEGALAEYRRTNEIIRDFGGLRDVDDYILKSSGMVTNIELEEATIAQAKIFEQERTYLRNRFGPWLNALRSGEQDLSTLSRSLMDLQIETLKKQAANKDDPDSANSAQRLLEDLYANVSFYLPRDFLEVGDYDRAIFALKIAIEIDPERPRAQWGLAQAYAATGQEKKAFETLRHAIALGKVDVERLETDPTWETLRKKPAWQEILEAAKSASG